jgi:transcriptional regulator GlxA family with amidase domain
MTPEIKEQGVFTRENINEIIQVMKTLNDEQLGIIQLALVNEILSRQMKRMQGNLKN